MLRGVGFAVNIVGFGFDSAFVGTTVAVLSVG